MMSGSDIDVPTDMMNDFIRMQQDIDDLSCISVSSHDYHYDEIEHTVLCMNSSFKPEAEVKIQPPLHVMNIEKNLNEILHKRIETKLNIDSSLFDFNKCELGSNGRNTDNPDVSISSPIDNSLGGRSKSDRSMSRRILSPTKSLIASHNSSGLNTIDRSAIDSESDIESTYSLKDISSGNLSVVVKLKKQMALKRKQHTLFLKQIKNNSFLVSPSYEIVSFQSSASPKDSKKIPDSEEVGDIDSNAHGDEDTSSNVRTSDLLSTEFDPSVTGMSKLQRLKSMKLNIEQNYLQNIKNRQWQRFNLNEYAPKLSCRYIEIDTKVDSMRSKRTNLNMKGLIGSEMDSQNERVAMGEDMDSIHSSRSSSMHSTCMEAELLSQIASARSQASSKYVTPVKAGLSPCRSIISPGNAHAIGMGERGLPVDDLLSESVPCVTNGVLNMDTLYQTPSKHADTGTSNVRSNSTNTGYLRSSSKKSSSTRQYTPAKLNYQRPEGMEDGIDQEIVNQQLKLPSELKEGASSEGGDTANNETMDASMAKRDKNQNHVGGCCCVM